MNMKSDGMQNRESIWPRSMRTLNIFTLLTLLMAWSGHAADQINQTEAPDGFYVGADTAPSYALPIVSNDGGPVTVQIREDGTFIPKHFVISATDKIPGGYFVKIDGQSTNGMTDLPGIVVIANHKAYFGYARRVVSSATVALLLNNREEAESVDSMLGKRFLLPPSPIGSPITNLDANKYTVQDMSPSTNWHWDQAMADALLAKANHDQDNNVISAYSKMMLIARVNGMPERPSEFPFPNIEGYANHPPPDYVNFYGINDHHSNYLLCEFDVDEKNYNQSEEPKWFNAALKQIRRFGRKSFLLLIGSLLL